SNNSISLDDVVVTGYQVMKKYNVTGAVNTINSKDIELRSSNSLQGILEGAVPGLTVYNNEYRIRGGASLNSGNKPLFIVDDFEVEELPENMDMVESITVLKDAAAAAIWGSRAANGVVVITTKKGKANDFRISYSGNVKVSAQPDFDDLHRVNSEQLIDFDRTAFLGGYYFPGYFGYSKSGYSLSQEIINDYTLDDMNDLTAQQLAAMDSRLGKLATNYNRKQIEDNLLRSALQHHHMLSISGGTDKVNYFLSGSFIGGASLNSGNKPLFIVDDFEVEELPENMDMVESITVLKDAAAAAIWGSRAANGVVVITTKKGKANDFRISYSGNVKVSAQPDFDDLHRVNSEQLIDFDRTAFLGGYYFPGYFGYSKSGYSLSQEIINDYTLDDMNDLTAQQLAAMDSRLGKLATNYNRKQIEDNLLRSALQHHHMLSISGGTDKVNYFLSGSFIGGHSSYIGDSNQSININSRTSYKILPFLTLRSDIIANFVKNDNGYSSLSSDIYNLYPFQMLLDENNNRIADYSSFNHEYSKTMVSQYGYYDQGKNLLDEVDMANDKTNGVNYKVRVGADFKIISGLSVSADYQYEKSLSTHKNIISKKSYDGRTLINSMAVPNSTNTLTYNIPNSDILDHQQATTDAWILKFGATLNRSFGADKQHYVNAVAGFEMRSRHYYMEKYRKLGYDDQILSWQPIDAVSLQDGVTWWNGDKNRYYSTSYDGFSDVLNKEISYFLSAVYTYDNRYTLSGSMRIDKSNLFGVSDKYRRNPIWALGANWNVKNEKFFDVDFISALMLRASWGLTGNFDRSGGTTPVMVGRRTYIPAVGDYVVRLSTPPNPKLRWERNRSTNVSLDLGLFDRINATFTYYNNSCYDLLGSTLLDPTTGYASARINAADMTNKGFELQLGVDVLKLRNFNWNVNWIFAHNSNKITNNNINESSPHLNRVTGLTEFVEGYAREAIWSYRWAGLDSNGEPMVYDKDGNKTYDIATLDADDLEYSGTYQPKYNGSFSTSFQYKNLQASFLFTYNFGHVFRAEYPSMDAYATSPSLTDKIADRWREPGDEDKTDIACLPTMEANWANTQYRSYAVMYSSNSIRNGNMIRLREILLNYEFPQNWLKRTPLRRLSLTAQFNNIWLWAKNKEGYDPEAVNPKTGAMSFSQPFSFTAGIKVDF
uniref:SusC/RagA family TonB-linked outer membrane protein n=1 Tax=Bacteroides acidifaciens TaxID=85831 RepID=UPI00242F127E